MSLETSHSTDLSKGKPLIADTKICSICLLSGSTDDSDPIVFCDRCGIIVHESCYNADALDEKSSDSSSPSEYWFCTPCLAQVDRPICALCPTNDLCQPFWPTLESTWIHVVCALAVPGVLFYDELYYTPVDISNISIQKFGNKICQICELRSGVTVACDAGLCPNAFHLSCANKNGLLQIRGELSKIECELYCVPHQSMTKQFKVAQRNFAICEVQQNEFDHRNHFKNEIRQALSEHWSIYKKRSQLFPKLPKPNKSHLARSLMADSVALKEFFTKAQRLHLNPTTINEMNNSTNVDLTSSDHNPLLAFLANEEELRQLRRNLHQAETKLKQLESSSIVNQLKEEQNQLEKQLNDKYEQFDDVNEKYHRLTEILKKYDCPLKDSTKTLLVERKSLIEEVDSCSVCHEKDRPGQMIRCFQCHLAFHGDCLTSAIPTKTLSVILSSSKKYDWQCASCVNAQQEELDQCHVDIEQPRQLRPRKTNELVRRETLMKFGSRKRKDEIDSNVSNEQIKERKELKISSVQDSPITNSTINEQHSVDEQSKCVNTQSRTSVIQQLFTRKSKDFSPKRTTSLKRKSSGTSKSPRISIKKSTNDDTTLSSTFLTNQRRTLTIFKQKSLSVPLCKSSKKARQISPSTTIKGKDPLSIFDFSDEDEDSNEIVKLRSSSTNHHHQDQSKKKSNRNSRRPTGKISKKTPLDLSSEQSIHQQKHDKILNCEKVS